VVSAEKQLTMPPQNKSKKNTPIETDQEDHYTEKDNIISFTAEPSQTTDQEQRAKIEALQKERAEKTAHTLNHSLKKMLMKITTRLSTENWKEYSRKYISFRKRKKGSQTSWRQKEKFQKN
jgi:hypothetical protein